MYCFWDWEALQEWKSLGQSDLTTSTNATAVIMRTT